MSRARAALWLSLALAQGVAASTSLSFCVEEPQRSAAQMDRVLRVAALLRDRLAEQGQPAALVARAGTNLTRFGIGYTHAAVALRDSPLSPWAVRQLYFACDERRSRLFDQGLAGFLLGTDDPDRGHAALLLLPAQAAEALARTALNTEQAQALLAAQYTANAHPYDLTRQNCNQWVAELLAAAWGQASTRHTAQQQLAGWHYQPEPVRYRWAAWRWLAGLVPWVSFAGHPAADAAANTLVTSLPRDLERLALHLWPGALRVELCYTPEHWVLRRGGAPLNAACESAEGDERGAF